MSDNSTSHVIAGFAVIHIHLYKVENGVYNFITTRKRFGFGEENIFEIGDAIIRTKHRVGSYTLYPDFILRQDLQVNRSLFLVAVVRGIEVKFDVPSDAIAHRRSIRLSL